MRRRQRRMCSWWRHEQVIIAAAVATALHHSAQRGGGVARRPTGTEDSGNRGTRPGVLKDPEPQLLDAVLAYRAAGEPSVATPLLAAPAAEGVDSSSLRFLTAASLAARRKEEEEEEKAKEAAKRKEVQTEVQQQAAEALEQARLLLERSKRKRKKRRKRKLPKTSSLRRPCAHAARVPAVLRRVFTGSSSLMAVACVMLVWLVTMLLALYSLLVSPGPGCSASWPLWIRRTVRSSSTMAVACARLVFLVILHLALYFFPSCRQVPMLGIPAGMDQIDCSVVRFWRTWCLGFRLQKTVDFPQLQSIKVVDISFVVQRLFPLVLVTTETPQLRVDTVVDALLMQVVLTVTCTVFGVRLRSTPVRQRILFASVCLRISAQCLVRQWIHIIDRCSRCDSSSCLLCQLG